MVSLEGRAQQLRHHSAGPGDDQLAKCGECCVGILQRGQIDHENATIEHDVAHIDLAVLDPEDVAKADGELGERGGEIELRETVLLGGLVALLLVERHRGIHAPGEAHRDKRATAR